jgi:competence protein CoiA
MHFTLSLFGLWTGLDEKRTNHSLKKTIKESHVEINNPPIQLLRVPFPDECRLLKEWHDTNALVFFDFQEAKETNQSMLWFLFPKIATNEVYMSRFSRRAFIEMHNENKFDEMVTNVIRPIRELVNDVQIRRKSIQYGHPSRVSGFERYMANQQRRQRRF